MPNKKMVIQKGLHNPLKLIILILVISACGSIRRVILKQELQQISNKSEVLSKYFVGLSLYDPESKQYLLNINGNKYFTPASNTKILTLATWLATGLDSIPSFKLAEVNGNAIIEPLGDPTLLHPDFPVQNALLQLATNYDTVFVKWPAPSPKPFATGWAWDDYNNSYQPERSSMPLYGNTLHAFYANNGRVIVPDFFEKFIESNSNQTGRAREYNFFQLNDSAYQGSSKEVQIPFKTGNELTMKLLQDTLGVPVIEKHTSITEEVMQIIHSYDRLPVLASMMLNSDNFLAEQLLVNAQLYSDNSNLTAFIEATKQSLFTRTPHPLEWVDGSGLSRYNMFTPMSLVKVLEVIYQQLSWQEINLIFPKGGVSGTIKGWYAAETPYVFAKTGTLRHNHCLSGYIQTKSGNRLIFSFMNNHYTNGSTEVKREMQKILEAIRDAY